MSTFDGFIREFGSQIIVDRFHASYLKKRTCGNPISIPTSISSALFLSHCHSDHMVGLDSQHVDFNIIYVHEVSKNILMNFPTPSDRYEVETFTAAGYGSPKSAYKSVVNSRKIGTDGRYAHLEPYLRVLQYGTPIKIQGVTDDITVTALNANHCPGSCMFLFESENRRVLYTGDFRLEAPALQQILMETPSLTSGNIDCMYVDTSHCANGRVSWSRYIPQRCVVIQHALDIIAANPSTSGVFIRCRQMIGYERLFVAIAEKFDTKIHVNKCWLKIFDGEAMCNILTTDPSATRFHAHHALEDGLTPNLYNRHSLKLPCCKQFTTTPRQHLFLNINGSGYFGIDAHSSNTQEVTFRPPFPAKSSSVGWYHIPYQQHSSVSEISSFIQAINPKVFYPCVVAPGSTVRSVFNCFSDIQPNAYSNYMAYALAGYPSRVHEKGKTRDHALINGLRGNASVGILGSVCKHTGETIGKIGDATMSTIPTLNFVSRRRVGVGRKRSRIDTCIHDA
eukprot:CFRG8134T1